MSGGKKAFIFILTSLIGSFQSAEAQSLITGRVIDKETGKYIKNVSVSKVGTDIKTVTNALGFFQIEASDSTKLQLSCDGYITMDVKVSGKENVKIEMMRRQIIAEAPVMPELTFPGGLPAFYEYISKNMNVPPGAPKGIVTVELLIDPTGMVIKDSVKVTQSLCKACDREALRVMKKSPNWNPFEQESSVRVVIPIRFN